VITSPFVFWMTKEEIIIINNIEIVYFISLFINGGLFFLFFFGHLMAVKKKWKEALLFLPNFYIFLALSVGISLYMVIGVLGGYF